MAFIRASASAHIFLFILTSSRCLIAASTRVCEIFTSPTTATRIAAGLIGGIAPARTVAGRAGGTGTRRAEAAATVLGVGWPRNVCRTGASRAEAAAVDWGWPRKVLASAEKVGALAPAASGDGTAPPAKGEPIAARCPFARRQYSTDSGVIVSFPHPARYFISARQTSPWASCQAQQGIERRRGCSSRARRGLSLPPRSRAWLRSPDEPA